MKDLFFSAVHRRGRSIGRIALLLFLVLVAVLVASLAHGVRTIS